MIMQKFFLIFAVALSIAGAVLASQKSTPNEDEMIMASVEALSNDEVVVGNTGPAKEKNVLVDNTVWYACVRTHILVPEQITTEKIQLFMQ